MSVEIELFGIARQRAGVGRTTAQGATLGEVLASLAIRFPTLAETCFPQGRFTAGYLANINGDRFLTDPAEPIKPGDRLLILSADAGG
jgi:sulfur-carrier protein